MSEPREYEITITVADKDTTTVRHLEVPLSHATPQDVAVDLTDVLKSRSPGKLRVINGER